ncbi:MULTISPECIES: UTP--glucose-1-phosphate uridylyltransferase GalU [Candidatus Methylopumilus]|uniref:UTP--glucose-1-phosphate uridylyltransferase GalU n=1 Tax=Candidatus Methylopumilus TaxID=1679002 RepID=UPI00112202E5|nr:UTP--glucose-1-phosphate uridylyltransferase GalU [Candidatus Methylopumilus planktonicus]QDD06923.1 UTP--glucose-1-phosphate uridylyltransferase GalU [Candidatus Methylopumilus planktonicus]QDD08259.1 UTP--glucose-1-phosphate uridylyltransferase GalU [Candidatus Methylopumilus planktonicus]QDD09586.1 UTP--glucose-1-phosphate uridylyltransferase GalU [Candidatus Methylopumilus planktonicus]
MKAIKKAVFPVAGLGTRFLPATKANPKEMLPIVDKPLIQYAVEEAIQSGITELIFVTGRNKRSIEDHFDKNVELEASLIASNKNLLLESIRSIIPSHVKCIYIRQSEPLGLGHAVLQAKTIINDEPFAVLLADDLTDADTPVLKQLILQHQKEQSSVIAIEDIPKEKTVQYGIVDVGDSKDNLYKINSIVEKPQPIDAPSTLGVIGRYVFNPEIFDCLEKIKPGKGGEIQLTDAIQMLLSQQAIFAYLFEGRRYDCGDKLGFIKANIEFSKKHPEIGKEFTAFLKSVS